MPTASFSTNFLLSPTGGTFVFTDTSNFPTQGIPLAHVNGSFKITSPSGILIYNNIDFTNSGCDINLVASLVSQQTIPLPNLTNSHPEFGKYTIEYDVYDSTTFTYYTVTNTYTYNYTSPKACIISEVDCIAPLFTTTDITNYIVNGVAPAMTRTIVLSFPAGSGGSPITNTTTATITVGANSFYTGIQSTVVTSDLVYTFPDGLIVTDVVTGTKSTTVDCSFICEFYCCWSTLNGLVEQNRGRDEVKFKHYNSLFGQVMAKAELLGMAISCGKQDDANDILGEMMKLSNCKNDCQCTDGSPRLVVGLGGISNVSVTVSTGGAPVVVTSSTSGGVTTYFVSLSASFVNLVNGLYNTVIVAGANVTVTPSGIIAGVQTYIIDANIPAATLKDAMWFRCLITYTPSPTVAVLVETPVEIDGTNFISPTIASSGYPSGVWARSNNYFNVTAFQVTPDAHYLVEATMNVQMYNRNGPLAQYQVVQGVNLSIIEQSISGAFSFRFTDMSGNPLTNGFLSTNGYIIIVNFLIKK